MYQPVSISLSLSLSLCLSVSPSLRLSVSLSVSLSLCLSLRLSQYIHIYIYISTSLCLSLSLCLSCSLSLSLSIVLSLEGRRIRKQIQGTSAKVCFWAGFVPFSFSLPAHPHDCLLSGCHVCQFRRPSGLSASWDAGAWSLASQGLQDLVTFSTGFQSSTATNKLSSSSRVAWTFVFFSAFLHRLSGPTLRPPIAPQGVAIPRAQMILRYRSVLRYTPSNRPYRKDGSLTIAASNRWESQVNAGLCRASRLLYGVSQLYCRKSRLNGSLSPPIPTWIQTIRCQYLSHRIFVKRGGEGARRDQTFARTKVHLTDVLDDKTDSITRNQVCKSGQAVHT